MTDDTGGGGRLARGILRMSTSLENYNQSVGSQGCFGGGTAFEIRKSRESKRLFCKKSRKERRDRIFWEQGHSREKTFRRPKKRGDEGMQGLGKSWSVNDKSFLQRGSQFELRDECAKGRLCGKDLK